MTRLLLNMLLKLLKAEGGEEAMQVRLEVSPRAVEQQQDQSRVRLHLCLVWEKISHRRMTFDQEIRTVQDLWHDVWRQFVRRN